MNDRIKTLEIALKRILKTAGPLYDISDWTTGDSDTELTEKERRSAKTHRRGIGWGMSRGDVDTAKWIMQEAPGDWVFVIPDNVANIEEKVRSESFKRWLEEKGYGEGYQIFVVGRAPFKGDFSEPQWIVHDLVGHSVGNKFQSLLEAEGIDYRDWTNRSDVFQVMDDLWWMLPQNLRNSNDPIDMHYDVATGIIFGKITLEQAIELLNNVRLPSYAEPTPNLKRHIEMMFSSAADWVNSQNWIQVGGNKVSVIYPWT